MSAAPTGNFYETLNYSTILAAHQRFLPFLRSAGKIYFRKISLAHGKGGSLVPPTDEFRSPRVRFPHFRRCLAYIILADGTFPSCRLSLSSALLLLMVGVLTDYHEMTLTPDYFALFANGLYRRSDFHRFILLVVWRSH